jgi:thioredoxin
MTLNKLLPLFSIILLLSACNSLGQKSTQLSPQEFEKLITAPNVQLVDVRTPEEFSEQHIKGALNINIRAGNFESEMLRLNKENPVYFYCLSGGRSAKAVQWAAANGFKEVYHLDGGILQWNNAGKPVESSKPNKAPKGMSQEEFLRQINQPKMVLVDFNAVWCGPCKILKPRVKNVVKQKSEVVELLDIDVDKNPAVSQFMNVSGIPLLILYKQGKEVWRKLGLAEESEIVLAIEGAK